MLEYSCFQELTSSWEYLKETKLPIFIYGMGDGCLKLLDQFKKYDIKETGIFASDEFVRGHSFVGHLVKTYAQVQEEFKEFVIVLAFGAGYPALIERIDFLATKHRLLVPDTAVVGIGDPFTKEYLKGNFEKAKKVYNLLADDFSKKVFQNLISYKITGDIKYLREVTTDPDEAYNNILMLEKDSTYVDLGAYNGDTVREFLSYTNGSYKEIYAVEPNKRNFRKLSEATGDLKNCFCINGVAWSSSGEILFSKEGGRMARVDEKGVLTACVSVDDVLNDKKPDYIKYDVEGAEKQAVQGSEKTISEFSPKLCVALYHRLEDLFDLPLQINEINSNYKFYIRHYPYYPAWETNLFCV
ncbi:MAG: FkbM family methyltransferase [Clostridiales bacterium]|nr:FkbM family methyltransferase [Clostridiales bacterium]